MEQSVERLIFTSHIFNLVGCKGFHVQLRQKGRAVIFVQGVGHIIQRFLRAGSNAGRNQCAHQQQQRQQQTTAKQLHNYLSCAQKSLGLNALCLFYAVPGANAKCHPGGPSSLAGLFFLSPFCYTWATRRERNKP